MNYRTVTLKFHRGIRDDHFEKREGEKEREGIFKEASLRM